MVARQTFLNKFASLSPFLFLDDKLYQISDRENGTDYLRIGSKKFSLVSSIDVSTLELFDRQLNNKSITEFKKEFASENLRKEWRSGDQVNNHNDLAMALEFILYSVMPLMIDTANEMGELLGVELKNSKTGKEVMEEIVNDEFKNLKNTNPTVKIKDLKQSLLSKMDGNVRRAIDNYNTNAKSIFGKVVGNNPLYFSSGNVFRLRPGNSQDLTISVNKKNYTMNDNVMTIDNLERFYSNQLDNILKIESINEVNDQHEIVNEFEKLKSVTDAFVKKSTFNYGNLGYVRKDLAFYVYWEMPKFAMQNPVRTEVYHPFEVAKVAVRLNASNGNIHHERAYIINKMVHPFLADWDNGYQHICIMSRKDYDSTAESIVRHVSTAINAFTKGLTLERLDGHGSRDDENSLYFGHSLANVYNLVGSLSRNEAVKNGYRITNEWGAMARRKKK